MLEQRPSIKMGCRLAFITSIPYKCREIQRWIQIVPKLLEREGKIRKAIILIFIRIKQYIRLYVPIK